MLLIRHHIALRRVGNSRIARIGERNRNRAAGSTNRQPTRDHDVRHTTRGRKRWQSNARRERRKEHIHRTRQRSTTGIRHRDGPCVLARSPVQRQSRGVQLSPARNFRQSVHGHRCQSRSAVARRVVAHHGIGSARRRRNTAASRRTCKRRVRPRIRSRKRRAACRQCRRVAQVDDRRRRRQRANGHRRLVHRHRRACGRTGAGVVRPLHRISCRRRRAHAAG